MAEARWDEALRLLDEALKSAQGGSILLGNKGVCLRRLGRFSEAEEVFRSLLSADSRNAAAWNSLGNLLKEAGRIEEAIPALEQAARLWKRSDHFSDWLFALNYSPSFTQVEICKHHLEYGALFKAKASDKPARTRTPGALRVGFVSADLCRHSVSYFFRPLLRQLDRSRFETFCYSDVACPDKTTAMIRKDAAHWVDSHSLSDGELEKRIREDELDILVDLSGHTGGNRLPVFAGKPARLQASWLGYPNTTGLSSIDFRLVDGVTDPEGAGDMLHSETLLRMPGCFLCYEGVEIATPRPRHAGRPFSFGCFNNAAKINDPLLQLWSEILQRCSDSRLVLKNKALSEASCRADLEAFFKVRGIAASRLVLLGPTDSEIDHLAAYGEVDLALDTHPYDGTTTTCEALWMGVPVLVLAGDRHASRVGASLLHAVGLDAFIAGDANDYVGKACAACAGSLALPERLALRRQLESSPLCDAAAYASSFGQILIQAWTRKFGVAPVLQRAASRSVTLNGQELSVDGEWSPGVLDCATLISQSLPEGRCLTRVFADGREVGGDELESAQFVNKLDFHWSWDSAWLDQREATLRATRPALAAQSRSLALEVGRKPDAEFIRPFSAFLEALGPLLEVQAQRLETQSVSGVDTKGSPLALHHERLSALTNRVMDAFQSRDQNLLRRLLADDIPGEINAG
jgi:predicted O-linked N-acetylglucosamine transferase (SPINDLY family)